MLFSGYFNIISLFNFMFHLLFSINIADSILNFNSLVISINPGVDYGVSITIEGGGLI